MIAAAQVIRAAVVVDGSKLPPPVLTYLPGEDSANRWRLEQSYSYRCSGGRSTLFIPEGFTFDLASVPRSLWSLIAPFELSIVAPLVHDYLYRMGGKPPAGRVYPPRAWSRKDADVEFRKIMELEQVSRWRRWPAYYAVRTFGRGSWQEEGAAEEELAAR